MKKIKFGTCLVVFDNCPDRYVISGYGKSYSFKEIIERTSKVKEIEAVELNGTWHFNDKNYLEVKKTLDDYGLKVCMVLPDLWAQSKWGKGSFTSIDSKLRKEAVEEVKKNMDIAAELDCDKINVWFGQDGYDYSFTSDYIETWNQLMEGLRECADYRKDIKICLEYKIKEPRTHIFVSNAAKTILLINETGKKNVGIVCDIGHAQVAQENVAESIALLNKKLWHIHINDNYNLWDDDMMFGSVHTIQPLEILYWLRKINYDGYYSLDMNPYREDGIEAARESIAWINGLNNLIDYIGYDKITELIKTGDATKVSKMLREAICR